MNQDNKKISPLIFVAVFFSGLIRSVVFATDELFGYNFDKKEVLASGIAVLFWISIILYSIFSAALIFGLLKKRSSLYWIPCLLLIADPALLITQKNPSFLLISVLWSFYLNALVSDKAVFKNISQILFLFIAFIISPKAAFGFIPLTIVTEFIPDVINKKRPGPSLPRLLSLSAAALGLILNKIFIESISAFKSFADFLSTAHSAGADKVIGVLLLSLPGLAAAIFFLYLLTSKNKKAVKKVKDKKSQNKTTHNESLLNLIFVSLILFIGSVFGGFETLCPISMFAPTVILMLAFSKNETAESVLNEINSLITKHSAAAAAVIISVFYICIRFYLGEFGGYKVADFFIINR